MAKNQRKAVLIRQADKSFGEFFTEYYANNRNITNLQYRLMKDNAGCTVEITYKDFKQYVNFYIGHQLIDGMNALVNTCFEGQYGERFLFYLTDVLNYIDSDDISFYQYPKCATDAAIKNALSEIMQATEKYYNDIANAVHSQQFLQETCEEYFDGSEYLSEVEEAFDPSFFTYELSYPTVNEFVKHLNKQHKKGKLEEGYEKRAYRVYSAMDGAERREAQKVSKKSKDYPKKFKLFLYLPVGIACVVFAVIFAVIGVHIDRAMFPDWLGRDAFETAAAFAVLGIAAGIAFVDIIERPLYKLIVPKKDYDDFMLVFEAENATGWMQAVVYILLAVMCAFFLFVFALNGTGVTADGNVVHKAHFYSQEQVYSLEDTDIAVLQYTEDYSEYGDTAYAFRLDGEWVEYGVPSDDAKEVIENAIQKYAKEVPTAETIGDLEE